MKQYPCWEADQQIPAFSGTKMIITMFTRACYKNYTEPV
jgi:hypothetical protein